MLAFNEERHEYKLNGIILPSVTQVIKSAGLSDFGDVNPDLLKRASNFGKVVHRIIELKYKGNLDESSVDDSLKGHISQWDEFVHQFNFKSERQETLWHHNMGYAGTIDHIGEIGDKSALVDIKTGTPRESDIIQICAYGLMKYADRLLIVYLSEDKYKVVEVKSKDRKKAEQVFLSCLLIYNHKKEKRII